jgi:hypothetical protein
MRRALSQDEALAQLQRAKRSFQRIVRENYEHAARDCKTCPTPGACCTDAHWVNVRISRLEAVAIQRTLEQSPRLTNSDRRAVYERARKAIEQFGLSACGNNENQTYSCPLYDRSVGCLVHRRAKPAPCIQHACYENWQDLPPDRLMSRTEHRVEQLNDDVYGRDWSWRPIPVWLAHIDPESSSHID